MIPTASVDLEKALSVVVTSIRETTTSETLRRPQEQVVKSLQSCAMNQGPACYLPLWRTKRRECVEWTWLRPLNQAGRSFADVYSKTTACRSSDWRHLWFSLRLLPITTQAYWSRVLWIETLTSSKLITLKLRMSWNFIRKYQHWYNFFLKKNLI